MATLDLLVIFSAYLLGSIPSAQIAARMLTGKTIHDLGDGNMGARNTFLSVGRWASVLVALADVGKGCAAVALARAVSSSDTLVLLAGVFVVIGHDFPFATGFRGGQGMAAFVGVSFVLFPRETIVAMAFLPVVLLLTHNWDASCATAFVVLVGAMILTGQPPRRLAYPFIVLPTIALRKLMQQREAHHAAA
jgi:acyl phosphate:glycerol-3-phosphate acyltransferase